MAEIKIKKLTADNISLLEIDDLVLSEIMNDIQEFTQSIIEFDDSGLALKLSRKLKEILSSNKASSLLDPELIKEYENIVTTLKFIGLFNYTDKEIELLFRESLLLAITKGVNINQSVKNYILHFNDAEIGVDFANLAMKALGQNNEILGNNPLLLDDNNNEVSPTVSNWIKGYNQFFPVNTKRSIAEEGEYLLKDKNVRKLEREDKLYLTSLIQLYDFLRFPDMASQEPTKFKDLTFGKLDLPDTTLTNEEESSIYGKEVLGAYQGNEVLNKQIKKELEKIQSKFGDDTGRLRAEFFVAVQKNNMAKTVAILATMVQKNDLENFLKEEDRLNSFLSAVWEKQFGRELVREFQTKPEQLKFVRLFLRYILEQRLGMDISDAARVGLQLSNIFVSLGKKSYNKMAYFDVVTKKFNWLE